jgi:serine/threonine-protein kinase HipA
MRKAEIFVKGDFAGTLAEIVKGKEYTFEYTEDYKGFDVSLTMPGTNRIYKFECFPPFFGRVTAGRNSAGRPVKDKKD